MCPPAFLTVRRWFNIQALLAVFNLLGVFYALLTPLFESSDELWHYPMVKTLADGQGLPIQDPRHPGLWRQEGSQPPLYYAVMALATFWVDTSDLGQVRWVNPHADNGLITEDRNNNIIIHTYRETEFPWQGTVLAVRLIRILSVLLGAATVYFTYRLALELWPTDEGLALAAAAFTAFTPMFVFISASVNNDNLAITLACAALWLMVRWARARRGPPLWQGAVMGLLLGGAALSKVSALGLWPLAGLALAYAHFRAVSSAPPLFSGTRLKSFFLAIFITFGVAALVSAWWFWRNYQLYNDWLGWSAFLDTVGRRPHPASLEQLWGERAGFVQAYWGLFGGVSVPLPDWVYTVFNTLAVLAGLGLLIRLMQRLKNLRHQAAVFLWLFPIAWIGLILIGLARWSSLTWASQGRLIFPAISAVSLLFAVGLKELIRVFLRLNHTATSPQLPTHLLGLPLLFMGSVTALTPVTVIAPHYAPPPALTPAQIAAIPHRVEADFGELKLLGYALDTPTVRPGATARLTLYWQSQIFMDRNWSVFVHLVDQDGIIAAQRDRYPGNGALATTLLPPGQTWADTYAIPIPSIAYAPTALRVEVGVFDLADGLRLPLVNGAESLPLTRIDLLARAEAALPNTLRQNFGREIELVGYTYSHRALRPGETFTLTLYWQALQPLPLNYSGFAHVRGLGETLWAGRDQWPQDGAAPTSRWPVSQIITDVYPLTLKPDTPAGQYPVEVGLYFAPAFERLRLFTTDGRVTDADFLDLAPIRVER
jgi:hypothetical protein